LENGEKWKIEENREMFEAKIRVQLKKKKRVRRPAGLAAGHLWISQQRSNTK
jgi:hypothetical protein